MDNMNTGLMIGLVIGVAGWTLLFNRRAGKKADPGGETEADKEKDGEKPI